MRYFVMRARKGATSSSGVRKTMGYPDHFEVIAHSVISALFVSKNTRPDVVFYTVMEGSPVPPVTVKLVSRELESLGGFDEEAVVRLYEKALEDAARLSKGESRNVLPGVYLEKISFEALIKKLADRMPLFMMDKKGRDIRDMDLVPLEEEYDPNPSKKDLGFLLTDHIPMQKKTYNLMKRLGVCEMSLGPVMLFAAHCITLVHNEIDRKSTN